MAKKNSKKSLSLTLRNYFIAGVVVLIPIGFTLYLSKILIGVSSNLIPANIKTKVPKIDQKIASDTRGYGTAPIIGTFST